MFDREQAIATIEAGGCACPGCCGQLTDASLSPRGWRHCQVCRCAWKAEAIGSTTYACNIENEVAHPRPIDSGRSDISH